ncbi:MAG: type II toxin-antitoxin system HicA family toxin [Planctomycetaceae bacterium]|nr:type II toxin-antitoxin system HicA family toxin [Planctomycetaceae bacterium]
MKRAKLVQHLRNHGCVPEREGGRHSIWRNPVTGARSAVPRHREVKFPLAKKICRDLDIPEPESDN